MRGPDRAGRRSPRLRSALALLALALAGCGGGPDEPLPDQSAVAAPSDLPVPISSGPRVQADGAGNVLTGEPAPDDRVLAVAVDDTAAAQPQVGLDAADVVYVVEVGDGATGLLALFQTDVPARVGPVRPAAPVDVVLLGGHGAVAFGAAAADPDVTAQAAAADLPLVQPDEGSDAFAQDPDRDGPPDVLADGAALLDGAPGSDAALDVGLRFGRAGGGGSPVAAGSYAWSASVVDFAWSQGDEAWVRQQDGDPVVDEDDDPVRADNVLFLAAPPELTGQGAVTLLRDGTAVGGSWARGSASGPTVLTDAAGEPLLLAVGTTWVVLLPEGDSPTLTED